MRTFILSIKEKFKSLLKKVGEVRSIIYGDVEDAWYTVAYHPFFGLISLYLVFITSRLSYVECVGIPWWSEFGMKIEDIGDEEEAARLYKEWLAETNSVEFIYVANNEDTNFAPNSIVPDSLKREGKDQEYNIVTVLANVNDRGTVKFVPDSVKQVADGSLWEQMNGPVDPNSWSNPEPVPAEPVPAEPVPAEPIKPTPVETVVPATSTPVEAAEAAGTMLHFNTFMAGYGKLLEGKSDINEIITTSLKFMKRNLPSAYMASNMEQLTDNNHPANVLTGFIRDMYVNASDADEEIISGFLLTSVLTHVTLNVAIPDYDPSSNLVHAVYTANLKKFGLLG